MTRPRWQWCGYLPRPPDDGRCAAWGGRCVAAYPLAWWTTCPAQHRRCHRSDAERVDAAARALRGLLLALRVL